VGSSHNRLTPAEDNEEALLSGYPSVVRLRRLDDNWQKQSNAIAYVALKTAGLALTRGQMNLNLSNPNQRGILAVVALLAAIFLSYFSIRNARAIYNASFEMPDGFLLEMRHPDISGILQLCLVRVPGDQPEDKIQGTAGIDDAGLVSASPERRKP
jgi:hypothetical protein